MLRRILRRMLNVNKTSSGKTLIGIDFGRHRIKALALSKHEQGYRLEAMASVATPAGAIIDYQLHQTPQLLAALTQLKASLNVRSIEVATAVTGSSVTTKLLQVPIAFTGEILALHMQQEASVHIPFSLNEISLDYEVLSSSEPHGERQTVLLSAARTDHVQAQVSALHQIGWRTAIVDIGSHALARAVLFLWPDIKDKRVAALDISEQSITLIVIEQREVIYRRLQPLAASLLPVVEYEETDTELINEAELAQIVQHTQRNIQLFCSNSGSEPPAQLFLFGGYRHLLALSSRLTDALQLSVQLPNLGQAFSHLNDEPYAPAYGTALGLALRSGAPCRT